MCLCLACHIAVSASSGAKAFSLICALYLNIDNGYLDREVIFKKHARIDEFSKMWRILEVWEQGALGEHKQFLELEN